MFLWDNVMAWDCFACMGGGESNNWINWLMILKSVVENSKLDGDCSRNRYEILSYMYRKIVSSYVMLINK